MPESSRTIFTDHERYVVLRVLGVGYKTYFQRLTFCAGKLLATIMAETWETVSFIVSGVFSFLAIILSFYLIIQHLRNWTVPGHQRHIVRLLLMVPVYAIDSWLSVRFKSASLYLDVVCNIFVMSDLPGKRLL